MQKPFFRICSLLLTVVLLVNMLPMSIFAEEFQEVQAAAAAEEAAKVTDAQIVAEVEENRTEYSKQFKLDNGLYVAAVYAQPVHYQEDGQWKEIDNTLTATTDGTYENTAGVWDVSLPQQLTGTSPVSISKDGYTLSFRLAGELRQQGNLELASISDASLETASLSLDGTTQTFAVNTTQTSDGQIQALDLTQARDAAQYQEFVLENNASQLRYANVYSNTHVQYDLLGSQVKESIILDSYSSTLRGYRYTLEVGDLVPVVNDDGSIHFYDAAEETIIMTMPAPYLVDENQQYSYDVQVSLMGEGGTYTLVYLLPTEWLAAEDRAWPVVLDPVVTTKPETLNIRDHTVASNGTYSYLRDVLECGYGSQSHVQRFFIKYRDLPEITSSDVVVYAAMTLCKPENGSGTVSVDVHKVLDTWESETLTWDNKPDYDPTVEDYALVTGAAWYTWDVTDIVRGWYAGGENTGMMFKASDKYEDGSASTWKQFASADCGAASYLPSLSIVYRNSDGLENYWNFTTSSAGRAGTGYVASHTGNLTWVRGDLGFGGNRMPVSISHIYNLNDSAADEFGLGYGWRTNFHEQVYKKTLNGTTYYVWEDSDGTSHYFHYDSGVYKDEDGLELTLKKTSSGGYTITSKQDNTSHFDAKGRLICLENNQGMDSDPDHKSSSINIAYIGDTNRIDYITDGADREYDFLYTDDRLSSISYLGGGTNSLHEVTFAYTDGNLTQISDKDNGKCYYKYDDHHLLKTAQDTDGYKLEYTYNTTKETYQPYRVLGVSETQGEADGGFLTFEYAHNQTTITDHNENVEILRFNGLGNVVTIQDDEGRAQMAKYTINDSDETGKANQLRLSSKLQNTVSNLCWGTSFEGDANSLTAVSDSGSGSFELTSGQHYLGSHSLHIEDDLAMQTGQIVVSPGQTMTFSAYVKSGGATAWLTLGGEKSETVSTAGDWTRLEVTYTNGEDYDQSISAGIQTSGTGDTYMDCLQLEESPTASRYNLVENGDFRSGEIGWSSGAGVTTPAAETPDGQEPFKLAAPHLAEQIYKMTGDPEAENRIDQRVYVSGVEGDTFVLAGWAKGDSVPLPEAEDGDDQRQFAIIGTFHYTDESVEGEPFIAQFNPDTDNDENWQYAAEVMVAKGAYDYITVEVAYDYNANTVYFDAIQLFKEAFGSSYTYDEDGDVISVVDLQKKNTTYDYNDNGDLTQILEDNQAKMTYTYDDRHNVLTAASGLGVTYAFEYDAYGNNTSVSIVNGENPKISTSATYTNDGNRLLTTTDALGKVTIYTYNADTNILESVQYPGDTSETATTYTYDEMYRMATTAATTDTGKALCATYSYSGDNLSAIQTPTTTYDFDYGAFGLRSEITVGQRTLAEYSYTDDGNFYLETLDYGNGDKVKYTYDQKGRVTSQTYEDEKKVTYQYDTSGALASMTDSKTERKTTYYYDLLDRLMKYSESGKDYYHSVRYQYDTDNNLSAQFENLYGADFWNSYVYDADNRVSAVGSYQTVKGYAYDAYGRPYLQVTSNDGNPTEENPAIKIDSFGFTSTQTATSSQIATHTVVHGTIQTVYTYTYDDNGNITSISQKSWPLSESEPDQAPLLVASYVYDSANQLIRENNNAGGFTHTWTYDSAGNITSRSEYAYTTGELGTPSKVISYTYPVTNGEENVWGDLLTAVTTDNNGTPSTLYEFEYDTIGNPINDGTWDYTWEHGRQLASMSLSEDAIPSPEEDITWDFTYNADGMRIGRTDGNTTYTYTYNGDKLTYLVANNHQMYFAYDANGLPMSMILDGVMYYYITNIQGDVIGLVDADGNEVVSYTYDAWGNPTSTTGSSASTVGVLNPLRYRSYVWDSETELYYLQSRYYNPEIGRFINADGVTSTGQGLLGNNMFAYCNNCPITFTDPLGMSPEWWQWAVSGGLVVLGGVLLATGVGGVAGGALICAGVNSIVGSYVSEATGGSSVAGWTGGLVTGTICGLGAGAAGGLFLSATEMTGAACLGTVALGGATAFGSGAIGSVTGSVVSASIDRKPLNKEEIGKSAMIGGTTNLYAALASGMGSAIANMPLISETSKVTANIISTGWSVIAEAAVDFISTITSLFD